MRPSPQIIARVAIFAALVFVFSYFTLLLPNVNPAFFIVFSAGYLWGIWPGVGVGAIGFFLWSNLNPSGPVAFPLLLSQLAGISLSAPVGVAAFKSARMLKKDTGLLLILTIAGIFTGLLYHLVVDVVDAWLYQPFWPRFISGLAFSLITIISNGIIFPLLYPALKFLQERESRRRKW